MCSHCNGSTWVKLGCCKSCRCAVKGCFRVHQKHSEFCAVHRCVVEQCEGRPGDSGTCSLHTCRARGCDRPKRSTLDLCDRCRCSGDNNLCRNRACSDSDWCPTHKCANQSCRNQRVDTFHPLCVDCARQQNGPMFYPQQGHHFSQPGFHPPAYRNNNNNNPNFA